jgi:hypothetical protein
MNIYSYNDDKSDFMYSSLQKILHRTTYIKFICALLQILFKMTANASVPCGICHLDCVGDREIFCDSCDSWFHYSCENLTNKAFNLLSKSPLPYSCSLCSTGTEDTQLSPKRLDDTRVFTIVSNVCRKHYYWLGLSKTLNLPSYIWIPSV